jgi:uncharacterized protein (TIGR02421 family)
MIEKKNVRRVCRRLAAEKPVHQELPDDGILHFEKLLPYICIYRYREPDGYFSGLLKTQASYLIVHESVDISGLVEEISVSISKKLNAFLILELWPIRKDHDAEFEIYCPENKAPATVAALDKGFGELKQIYPAVSTQLVNSYDRHPKHLKPLLEIDEFKESGGLLIGIGVPTLYERPEEKEVYSLFYRKFYSRFSEIIKRAAYEFIRVQTANPFHHYLMLGKTILDRVTKTSDRQLATLSEGMSFLLRTTPVNTTSEWKKFRKNNFSEEPSFNYRLIALDPEQKKRKLYDIPIEQVEDPTIAFILRDKRLEIEKQLTMLEERGTDNFRFVGESLYGKIEDNVIDGAQKILANFPKGQKIESLEQTNCYEFAEKAREEIDYYQEQFPKLKLSVEIRKDVAGIMVSKTRLLISDQLLMDKTRTDALIQHEIGTHILTYCNGKNQPLRQMYAGFAGYDALQEGLAVLAEFLVGGLTINRMRILAARVLAADAMVRGADFMQTFTMLRDAHQFSERRAYYITMRIFRGGGLTKDAVYLAGLMQLMDYLEAGGKLETLYSGKFNINHVTLVEELLHRNVLREPVLPRFLEREEVKERLLQLRKGMGVSSLLNSNPVIKKVKNNL